MKNSLISIILPTYNVEKYIARALNSCINQSFKDIEIIVVDDCGSDNSIAIAKEYALKDERIKIIHNEKNLGTFAARNEGVKYSSGAYLMFLDPDDYLELKACEILAALSSVCKICQFSLAVDGVKLKMTDTFKHLKKFKGINWQLANLLIKRDVYLQSLKELFTIEKKLIIAEDFLAFFFLLNHISEDAFLELDLPLYNYVNNSDSITKKKKK